MIQNSHFYIESAREEKGPVEALWKQNFMSGLPENMPADGDAAFAHIGTVTTPSVDDLKIMVCLEASGQGFYQALADAAPNEEAADLLARSGREEMAHAHRLIRVIKMLNGEDFAVPGPDENPYYAVPEGIAPTPDLMATIAEGEYGGEALYEGWAQALGDPEMGKLLRQNGKEEKGHGERAEHVAILL